MTTATGIDWERVKPARRELLWQVLRHLDPSSDHATLAKLFGTTEGRIDRTVDSLNRYAKRHFGGIIIQRGRMLGGRRVWLQRSARGHRIYEDLRRWRSDHPEEVPV